MNGKIEVLEETTVDEEAVEETTEEILTEDDGSEVIEQEQETDEVETEENYFTQDQVEAAIKARVSTFNKKLEKVKPYEQAIRKMSDITGLSVNELINRLENMSDAEQAKILGITPQQYAQRKQLTSLSKEADAKAKKLERELEEQKLIKDPKYKDYKLYKDAIEIILEENPNLSLKNAYILAKGEAATKAAVRDAEQRAIAKMTKSSNQKIIKPGSTGASSSPKLSGTIVAAAKRVGMDPQEYQAFSNITNLEEFERFQSSRKGGK